MNDAGVCSASIRTRESAGWMPLLQRLEVQAVVGGDDDLAVDHAALRQLGSDRRDQFGEVAGHRPLVAAAQLDLVAVAEADRPEAVPLRLVGGAGRDRRAPIWPASATPAA